MTGIFKSGHRPHRTASLIHGGTGSGTFNSDDMAMMRGAFDAVCSELRIGPADGIRRDDVARRIIAAYETGRRAPLYLVDAGLSEHA